MFFSVISVGKPTTESVVVSQLVHNPGIVSRRMGIAGSSPSFITIDYTPLPPAYLQLSELISPIPVAITGRLPSTTLQYCLMFNTVRCLKN